MPTQPPFAYCDRAVPCGPAFRNRGAGFGTAIAGGDRCPGNDKDRDVYSIRAAELLRSTTATEQELQLGQAVSPSPRSHSMVRPWVAITPAHPGNIPTAASWLPRLSATRPARARTMGRMAQARGQRHTKATKSYRPRPSSSASTRRAAVERQLRQGGRLEERRLHHRLHLPEEVSQHLAQSVYANRTA